MVVMVMVMAARIVVGRITASAVRVRLLRLLIQLMIRIDIRRGLIAAVAQQVGTLFRGRVGIGRGL
jgi:hypothetical protein